MTRFIIIFLLSTLSAFAAPGFRDIRLQAILNGTVYYDPPVPSDRLLDWNLYIDTTRTSGTVYTNLPVVSAFEINRAITNAYAAGTNNIVTLSNQTYLLDSSIWLLHGVRLRGQGTNTCLQMTAAGDYSPAVRFGNESGAARLHIDIHSGSWKGSTNISLTSSLSTMLLGSWAVISATNDWNFVYPFGLEGDIPTSWTAGDEPETPAGARIRGDLVKLISITDGTNLNFWPPLTFDYTNTPSRWSYVPDHFDQHLRYAGLENLAINTATNSPGVYVAGVHGGWVSNVQFRVMGSQQAGIKGFHGRGFTVQHCGFNGYALRPYGLDIRLDTGGWLVENNWFADIEAATIFAGRGNAHVVVGNYVHNIVFGLEEFSFHGGHKQFGYFAHNAGYTFWADLIHASSSHHTLFRNWFKGESTNASSGAIHFDQFNLTNAVVGNVLGYSGMTGFILSKAVPDSASTKSLYSWNYNGYSGVTNVGGQHADTTTIVHGNVTFESGSPATNWISTRSRSLTNCYFYTSRPSWWGTNLSWPAFGPDIPGLTNMIPAQVRYLYGTNSY